MSISIEKVLFPLMGFLNYRCADGMVPNEFPSNHIIITMHDGCTADGDIMTVFDTPWWLRYNAAHPDTLLFYMRMPYPFGNINRQFHNNFNEIQELFVHDPSHHTPMTVQIHLEDGEYYLAHSFQVYNVSQQRDYFPPANYIYVAVPHGKVYRAVLRHQPYKKNVDRQPYLFPGLSKKRRWLFWA